MEDIKWIFFDVGSTLVDETDCYKTRIKETAAQTNKITEEQFEMKMINYAKQNKDAYKETIKELGLNKTKWNLDKEKLYPNVIGILKELKKGYKLGIIANQKVGLSNRLNQFGILDFFNVVICSDEVGISKPNKDIFLLGLQEANCEAKNSIMVGDRLDNDLIPAKKIGMRTIWVKQGYSGLAKVENSKEFVDIEIKSINEICEVLK